MMRSQFGAVSLSLLALLAGCECQTPERRDAGLDAEVEDARVRPDTAGLDVMLADALYTRADFFNFLLDRNKQALVVLTDERRNLYKDVADGLFSVVSPVKGTFRSRHCLWWDFPRLAFWPEVKAPVRVVRSLETRSIKRQLRRKRETLTPIAVGPHPLVRSPMMTLCRCSPTSW